MALSIIGNNY
ncbi:unnamed protein product [Leptidea sinapis]|uniref:Uncharacterized protein n=1 Tax=Leptidea sinapis TaxID=189913 RepID=A0A5E4QQP1_9NEOP|nr:unnamed protein product [Leptidea sinapis]